MLLIVLAATSAPFAAPPRMEAFAIAEVRILTGKALNLNSVTRETPVVGATINTAKALVEFY